MQVSLATEAWSLKKQATQSVLAANLFDAVQAFDSASTVRTTFNELFGSVIFPVLYNDWKSLVYSVAGLKSVTGKCLLIDLFMLG